MKTAKSDCRVVSYITAYKDERSIEKCIESIENQSLPVEVTLILDNSPHSIQLSQSSKMQINILHCPSNKGVAFGLNWSLSWAYENDYDFLWLFDQDSSPHQDCLAKLLDTYTKCFRKGDKVSIVSCTPVDVRTGHVTAPALFLRDQFVGMKVSDHIEPYECDAPITSGSLLNVNLVAHIPPSDPKLFIDGIDLEYGLRLKKAGFKNIVVPDAIMDHHFGEPVEINIFGKTKFFKTIRPCDTTIFAAITPILSLSIRKVFIN